MTVLRAPLITGIKVTFTFYSFFSSLEKSGYSFFFSLSYNFTLWSAGTAKSVILQVFFCWLLYSLVVCPRSGDLFVCQNPRGVCVSFTGTDGGLCTYHLFEWSNWNFLHISQWIPLPTKSCLFLYSFCVNMLHSRIMWLIGSSFTLHLLFCWVLSILALI